MSQVKAMEFLVPRASQEERTRARAYILAAYPDEADVFLDALGLDGAQ